MSLDSLLSQTVTILRFNPGVEDEMGNTELASVSVVTTKGRIQRVRADAQLEVTVGRDTAISDWVGFLPAGTVVDHQDQITEGNRTFEVLGTPYEVETPRGPHHMEVRLRLAVA